MNTAYETLVQFLDAREVRYVANQDDQSICVDLRGEVASYRILAQVDAEAELFQVLGYSPVRIPEGCRSSIAEVVSRANYGLRVGKFEMDFDDGELRFQISQILTDGGLGEAVIDRMIGSTLAMLDMYLPSVLSVLYGNELPKDAIRCAEKADVSQTE
jgi:hypothetical protein